MSTSTGSRTLFLVQPTQGANLISNVPHNLVESGRTIATIVAHALAEGVDEVEATREAQDAWIDMLLAGPRLSVIGSPDCTPGYYNNEGQDRGPGRAAVRGLPRGRHRVLPVHRRLAQLGRLRGPRAPPPRRRPAPT